MKFLRASIMLMLMAWATAGTTVFAQAPAPPASAPTLVRIDGALQTPTGEPRTGEVVLVVSIYSDQAATSAVWTEEHQVTLDAAGRYTLTAGATQTDGIPKELFLSGAAHWVGVGVLSEPEQPRFMLVSVPYALKAREADTLSGKSATDFVLSENLSEGVKNVIKATGGVGAAGGSGGPTIASTTNAIAKFSDTIGTVADSGIFEVSGNVGVGTSTPGGKLHVRAANATLVIDDVVQNKQWAISNSGGGMQISRYDNGNFVATRFSMGTDANNVVGYNTADSSAQLNVVAASGGLGALSLASIANASVPTLAIQGGPAQTAKLTEWKSSAGAVMSVVDASGNLGIGIATPTSKLHVVGDALVTGNAVINGNIAAKYQDVAEWVETPTPLESGTVVIVDPATPNQVIASSKAYDTRVAGAVSAQPGLILGDRSETKEMVAQSGRVRIKVDATRGAIKIGDLLVTSPTPGYAMLSKPIRIGGQSIHRPGTLLGKALEALPSGKGEILVLLTLQ